jgi:hypothetical protein
MGSGRVDLDVHLILHKRGDTTVVCYVDHHDAAYAWAKRHVCMLRAAQGTRVSVSNELLCPLLEQGGRQLIRMFLCELGGGRVVVEVRERSFEQKKLSTFSQEHRVDVPSDNVCEPVGGARSMPGQPSRTRCTVRRLAPRQRDPPHGHMRQLPRQELDGRPRQRTAQTGAPAAGTPPASRDTAPPAASPGRSRSPAPASPTRTRAPPPLGTSTRATPRPPLTARGSPQSARGRARPAPGAVTRRRQGRSSAASRGRGLMGRCPRGAPTSQIAPLDSASRWTKPSTSPRRVYLRCIFIGEEVP